MKRLLISYKLKSESNLISAKILLQNKRLEEAVSLAYYSMYHMLTSLFYKVGIKSENHTASILILKKLFDLDNKDIKYSKKERIDTQYYLDSHITEKQVFEAIESAEDFSKRLTDFVAKLTTQQIYEYRKSFKYLISGKPKNWK